MAKVLTIATNGQIQELSVDVGNPYVYTTIDFGTSGKNEVVANFVDANCTTTSKIDIGQYFISQTEQNFGVYIDLFTECFNGNFNIYAISRGIKEQGIFNIKYKIL